MLVADLQNARDLGSQITRLCKGSNPVCLSYEAGNNTLGGGALSL